jgi:hypothetical protein
MHKRGSATAARGAFGKLRSMRHEKGGRGRRAGNGQAAGPAPLPSRARRGAGLPTAHTPPPQSPRSPRTKTAHAADAAAAISAHHCGDQHRRRPIHRPCPIVSTRSSSSSSRPLRRRLHPAACTRTPTRPLPQHCRPARPRGRLRRTHARPPESAPIAAYHAHQAAAPARTRGRRTRPSSDRREDPDPRCAAT